MSNVVELFGKATDKAGVNPELIIENGYIFRAVHNMVPVRDKPGDPLRMVQDGWKKSGIPKGKIIFYKKSDTNNPVLNAIRASGYIVAEIEN